MQIVMFMPVWTREEQSALRLHYLVPDVEGHLANGGHSSRSAGYAHCDGCNALLEEKKRRKREYH